MNDNMLSAAIDERSGEEPAVDLFPAFRRYATQSGLINKAKGSLAARLPRILGQGSTRSVGLDAPPAPIERKIELAGLKRADLSLPTDVMREIEQAERDVDQLKRDLLRDEGVRKLATQALDAIDAPKGYKDQRFFAGGLILVPEKGAFEWAWCLTPHYPIVKKIPPDARYVARAFHAAQKNIVDLAVPPSEFEDRLRLAWTLARHFSRTDDVLVTDVMRMFNVAAQPEKFWQAPRRQNFVELPEAAFVVSLMQFRKTGKTLSEFEFVPATLHHAHGRNAKVFFLPMNPEGTEVRPMVYLRHRS